MGIVIGRKKYRSMREAAAELKTSRAWIYILAKTLTPEVMQRGKPFLLSDSEFRKIRAYLEKLRLSGKTRLKVRENSASADGSTDGTRRKQA
ncbi:MAG: hypothetical protein RML36_15365 [Anaerolineae bacterium]|nr:hypothetical protein [Anaerolineae bacterium]